MLHILELQEKQFYKKDPIQYQHHFGLHSYNQYSFLEDI